MDTTYYARRLSASIAMMNAASDTGARIAHKVLADRYRKIVQANPTKVQTDGMKSSVSYHADHALFRWADDGGRSGKPE